LTFYFKCYKIEKENIRRIFEMKKMKTLFRKEYDKNNNVTIFNEVVPGCEWVLNGEGVPTQKLDGTCCFVKDGEIYARFDYKKGRKLPEGAIPCQDEPDPITGHFPHWVKVEDQPQYKYHKIAFEKNKNLENGTYELIGKHFQGNPEKVEGDIDILVKHGSIILEDCDRTFEGIKDFLKMNYIEGIVYHRENGDMCKIKRTDFGFEWNGKYKK
jgi:hypothetical protein